MTVPSTPRRRTTRATPGEVSPDTSAPTKVVLDEDAKAMVTEQLGGKTLHYEATIKQDENANEVEGEDEDGGFDDETGYSFESETPYQEIPKDPLTSMFDALREAARSSDEVFIANIFRRQDFMNDSFNVPCAVDSQFPPLQFSARDIFTFVSTIQKHNNNSGGRFTVRVYRQDGTPVKTIIGRNRAYVEVDLGIAMLAVPNPTREQIDLNSPQQNGNGNGNGGINKVLEMIVESQRQMQMEMLKLQYQRTEPSGIEKQILEASLQRMLNPPPPVSNGLEHSMAQIMAAPIMVQKMVERAFPEPILPHEPTTMDTIKDVMSLPVVESVMNGVMNMADAALAAKMTAGEQNPSQPAADTEFDDFVDEPQPQELSQADIQMQDLIEDVIEELKSDRPLNAENPMIQKLSQDYAEQLPQLKDVCKIMTFDQTLALLMQKTERVSPNPFMPFLNLEETQRQSAIIWNQEGEKLRVRLNEFYEYIKL